MAYSNAVAPGHWNSYGTGTGPNQAAAIGRYQSARTNSGQWRGTGRDGRDVYYNPGMQRSYLGPRRNVVPRYGSSSNYSNPAVSEAGGLPEQFSMPYRINQMVQTGYEDRETASAGNLAAIGQGYGRRMANSGMNLDKIAQGYKAREAAAGERLNELMEGYQQRYSRNMANLEGARANELSRIDEDYQKRAASNMQDLVSRGLRNSSVAATSSMGVERARQQSIADVNEMVRKERMAADMDLSGDALSAARDRIGVEADLSGQSLNFGAQANDVQNALYSDQLRFQTGANDTQNALASDRLRFTERTKADYPGWEDGAAYAQQLAAANAQNYGYYGGGYGGGYGYGGGGGPTWNPQTRTWQNGGGSYVAGIGVTPLADLGYNVPNMTTMPAANLRPSYWNNSMGRSDASLNNAAARRGEIEATRTFNANQRLSAPQQFADPNDPNGGMGPSVQQQSPQGRYLGGGRYSVPGKPNTFTMDHDLARQAEARSNLAAQYRQQGMGAGYAGPSGTTGQSAMVGRSGGPNIMRFPGQTPMARPTDPLATGGNPWAVRRGDGDVAGVKASMAAADKQRADAIRARYAAAWNNRRQQAIDSVTPTTNAESYLARVYNNALTPSAYGGLTGPYGMPLGNNAVDDAIKRQGGMLPAPQRTRQAATYGQTIPPLPSRSSQNQALVAMGMGAYADPRYAPVNPPRVPLRGAFGSYLSNNAVDDSIRRRGY